MLFLTSKFTVHNFKAFAIALSPLLAAILGIFITIKSPATQMAEAQVAGPDPACVARGLTDYMNKIIDARKADPTSFNHIKLLSPAFNITSNLEAQIFDLMVTQGGVTANFEDLDGFAGNTYSHVTGAESTTAMQWYSTNAVNGRTWMNDRFMFQNSAKNTHQVHFTEFGDFDFNSGDRASNIALASNQNNLAGQNIYVGSINYFNALGGNPEFASRHQLSSGEYNQITGSYSSEAGVNSAMPVNASFPSQAQGYSGNVHWTVQISYSRGDKALVEDYVKQAYQRGITPILRICAGNTCDFADVNDYINFLKSLDLVGDLYVLAGPNEPGTELWATPECIRKQPLELHTVACDAILEPEYHSLRPYPANPCNVIPSGTTQCGNDLVVNETIEVNRSQGHDCVTSPDGGVHCEFTVQSSAIASVDLSRAELPIVGNTELVPNSLNANGTLSFDQRVTDYVSWYMNGVVQRAEERFFSFPSDAGLLLNFSGPLRKILPFAIQNGQTIENQEWGYVDLFGFRIPILISHDYELQKGLRLKQDEIAKSERHDQTVVCGDHDNPEACYSTPADPKHLKETVDESVNTVISQGGEPVELVQPKQSLDYVPFSSTEDRVGTADLIPTGAAFTSGDVQISNLAFQRSSDIPKNLYFAHMQESTELGSATQKTFVPKDFLGNLSQPKTDDIIPPQVQPGCVINDTRTNGGDNLYADAIKDNNAAANPPLQGTVSFTANFGCDFTPTVDQSLYFSCVGGGYCETRSRCAGTWSPDPTCEVGFGNCSIPLPAPGDFSNPYCREYATVISSTCQKQISIPLQVLTKTPEAESVWNQYVAGAWSIFRRFFPKVGPGTPVASIQDIPGETTASYNATSQGAIGGTLVSTSVSAGGNRPASNASLYIPHVGSLSDYFLNGIQEALHPYGMGPKTLVNNGSSAPAPGATGGQCILSGSGLNSQVLRNLVVDAASWAHIPVQTLVAVIHGEACQGGGPLCLAGDSDVLSWIQPGAELPYNCTDSEIGYGPLGFGDWTPYKNAVNAATGDSRTPNVCNVKDAVYAAAYVLSTSYGGCSHVSGNPNADVSNTPAAPTWTLDNMKTALTAWACGCSEVPACQPAKNYYENLITNYVNGGVTLSCSGTGGSGSTLCDASNMQSTFGTKANVMSCICKHESGGNPLALNDACLGGGTQDYSVGLFQVNMLSHPDIYSEKVPDGLKQQFRAAGIPNWDTISCTSAFYAPTSPCNIKPGGDRILEICKKWFFSPENNIAEAKQILDVQGLGAWTADAKYCGF